MKPLTERQVKLGNIITFVFEVVMWMVIFATILIVVFVFL